MRKPLKSAIVTHICYRDIFKSPILIQEMVNILSIDIHSQGNFEIAINELCEEGLIEKKNGYLVSKGNLGLIDLQPYKNTTTENLIKKGNRFLKIFSKIPFVKLIAISGSLAANNPVLDRNGMNKGKVDMDLFVISEANTMWILFLFERIITNLYKFIFRQNFYCFNYVTDYTFLGIHNKNFYTATELFNMKLIYDNNIFDEFLLENEWYLRYYPEVKKIPNSSGVGGESFLLKLLFPVNYLCYIFFCIGRSIKRMELTPIREISWSFNAENKCNLKRIANSNGGYQELIKERFKENYIEKFSGYYSNELLNELFPSSESFRFTRENSSDSEFDQLFEKYAS